MNIMLIKWGEICRADKIIALSEMKAVCTSGRKHFFHFNARDSLGFICKLIFQSQPPGHLAAVASRDDAVILY